MIVVVDYLRKSKSGMLMYRRRFPRELVKLIPCRSPKGREFFQFSLRAKNINEPGAMDRYRTLDAEYEAIVDLARRKASRVYDDLSDPLIEFFAETYKHDALAADDAMRWGRKLPDATCERRGGLEGVYDDCRELLEEYDLHGIVDYWRDWVCEFTSAHGYVIDPNGPRIADLCQAITEAACAVWLAVDRRIDRRFAATPPEPVKPQRASPATGLTMREVADIIMASPVSQKGQTTIEAWSTALRFFSEVHGEPMVTEINRSMVSEWLDILAQKPARLPKEERQMTLPDIASRYEGEEDVRRVSRKTLRGHLASLATIWNQGQEKGKIDETLANPFKARRELAGGDTDQGTEFSMSELQALFDLPLFTQGDRPTQGRGSASYWMPLLLLWTGVRPEEAAQLLVSDFEQDEATGEWLLTITDEGRHPVKGKRSLKTEDKGTAGRRTFIVHPELQRLGLMAYVQHLRSKGEQALFPRLTVKNKKRGYLYPSVSEWWGRYIRQHGVVLEGHNRRPYRDFRQSWATAAREADISDGAMSYLMGHSNKQQPQTQRYGKKHPYGLKMAEMAYPKLDLSRIRPWAP